MKLPESDSDTKLPELTTFTTQTQNSKLKVKAISRGARKYESTKMTISRMTVGISLASLLKGTSNTETLFSLPDQILAAPVELLYTNNFLGHMSGPFDYVSQRRTGRGSAGDS